MYYARRFDERRGKMGVKETLNELETKQEIDRLLGDFDKDFNSNKVEEFREEFPRYVALYTPFIYRPDIAIRGINPSWFIGEKPETDEDFRREDKRVNSLKGLHDFNAYIKYPEPLYHYYLRKDFEYLSADYVLENKLMGWNYCFIQSGSAAMDPIISKALEIDTKNQNSYCSDLIEKSKFISKRIENLVQPKLIVYAGENAAKESGKWDKNKYKSLKDMVFKHTPTPWGGRAIVVSHFSRDSNYYSYASRKDLLLNHMVDLGINSEN